MPGRLPQLLLLCLCMLPCGCSIFPTTPLIHRPAAPVPPTQEIVILDPGVDPVGNPTVLTKPKENGLADVDIPPSVVVHKFYYTGDRNFQGPMLPGGPTVVVAGNPHTGERTYVATMLPPGAPRVYYTGTAIRYDYGYQSVSVCFGLFGKAKVLYTQQPTDIAGRVTNLSENMLANARRRVEESRIFNFGANLVGRTAESVENLARFSSRPAQPSERIFIPSEPGLNVKSPAD